MDDNERTWLSRIKPNLSRRAQIVQQVRSFFYRNGYIEIETPVRVPSVAPESEIVPFQSEDWLLTTSPELYMKRLLAAGYDRIFQISRCFRKGELGRLHNPEFTLLEWYRVDANYMDMITDTEQLVQEITKTLNNAMNIVYKNTKIDLTPPWRRVTVSNAFKQHAGWDPAAGKDLTNFDDDLVSKVIPGFDADHPTVLMDYPAELASLAQLKTGKTNVAERAEVFIGGLEIANAYTELTNAAEQKQRFIDEMGKINTKRSKKMPMPDKFLEAVHYMPSCGGIALGLDRLVMLLCNADSVSEVMAFTVENA